MNACVTTIHALAEKNMNVHMQHVCTYPHPQHAYLPPPTACIATILGKRHMLPVPTAVPRELSTTPIPERKVF